MAEYKKIFIILCYSIMSFLLVEAAWMINKMIFLIESL